MLEASLEESDVSEEVVRADDASATVDIPEAHLNPPTPPLGGIDSILEGATDDNLEERFTAYVFEYYPLVALEDDVVSQLDERARVEYKRRNAALDREMFDSIRSSLSATQPNLLALFPQDLLDTLRKEGLIE